MRVHYLQHVPFEGLGTIEQALQRHGAEISGTRLDLQQVLPAVDDFDWLVVMGGPMGVYDEEEYTWLKEERKFLREAVAADKTILGICLGAQLLADALGAKVYRHEHSEIGWFPVTQLTDDSGPALSSSLPVEFTTFHWHSDTFELPAGARQLARSQGCEQQAFAMGEKLLGLQFHLEATRSFVDALIEHCGSGLNAEAFVQSPEQMLAEIGRLEENNRMMETIVNQLASSAPG